MSDIRHDLRERLAAIREVRRVGRLRSGSDGKCLAARLLGGYGTKLLLLSSRFFSVHQM